MCFLHPFNGALEPQQYKDLLEPDTKSSLDYWPSELREKHVGKDWKTKQYNYRTLAHIGIVWDDYASLWECLDPFIGGKLKHTIWSEQKSILKSVTFSLLWSDSP